jgi:hypothetical protein
MTAVVIVVVAAVVLVAIGFVVGARRRKPGTATAGSARRVLVPFTGGELEPTVLAAAIRIARAEEATLVPAYLLVVPLELPADAPVHAQVAVAMPLLEAVENASLRAGVPVDARVESGRSPIHALQRLWEVERFDRIVAPAPAGNGHANGRGHGFTPKDLTWMLVHAPSELVILRPDPHA